MRILAFCPAKFKDPIIIHYALNEQDLNEEILHSVYG
jgi:hypothetical protein